MFRIKIYKTPHVNAISQNDVKSLQETIVDLSKKVETLNRENIELKQIFTSSKIEGQKQYRKPFKFYHQKVNSKSSCTSCGNIKCSGKREECFARGKACHRCKRIGHYVQKCRSVRHVYGEIIKD